MIHLIDQEPAPSQLLPIRRDIPVPLLVPRGGRRPPGPVRTTAEALRPGESFLAPAHLHRSAVSATLQRIHGRRFTSSMTPEGLRIWRIL